MASTKPGSGTVYYQAGSQQDIDDLIAAQDRARAMNQTAGATAKSWAPWLIGGLIVGGVVWWIKRD